MKNLMNGTQKSSDWKEIEKIDASGSILRRLPVL